MTFATYILGNALYVHPVAYLMEVLFTWIYNRYVNEEDVSLDSVYVPAMISAFYLPPKSPNTNVKYTRWEVIKRDGKRIGATLIIEAIGFVIFGFISLIIRSLKLMNEIIISNDKNNNSEDFIVLKTLFNNLTIKFEVSMIIAYGISYLLIYTLMMVIYYRFGNRYEVMNPFKGLKKTEDNPQTPNFTQKRKFEFWLDYFASIVDGIKETYTPEDGKKGADEIIHLAHIEGKDEVGKSKNNIEDQLSVLNCSTEKEFEFWLDYLARSLDKTKEICTDEVHSDNTEVAVHAAKIEIEHANINAPCIDEVGVGVFSVPPDRTFERWLNYLGKFLDDSKENGISEVGNMFLEHVLNPLQISIHLAENDNDWMADG